MESEIGSQTSVFNSILTRIHEADINQQQVESEMDISSLAQLPGMPISPVSTKVLAIGSVGGLAFGVLLAMIFIRLDNKIHTVAQVERETGLPALAAIAVPAKAAPGKINSGTVGNGSPHHLASARFAAEIGASFTHVPYKSIDQVVTSLLAGDVQVTVGGLPSMSPLIRSGNVRPLAVTSGWSRRTHRPTLASPPLSPPFLAGSLMDLKWGSFR